MSHSHKLSSFSAVNEIKESDESDSRMGRIVAAAEEEDFRSTGVEF